MTSKRLTSLLLAAAVSAGSALALADSSTGTTNPTGTQPSSVGLPAGSGAGLPNRNTDGSTSTTPSANKSVDGPNTPKATDTHPTNGKKGMGGTGSEGLGTDGAAGSGTK